MKALTINEAEEKLISEALSALYNACHWSDEETSAKQQKMNSKKQIDIMSLLSKIADA